MVTCWREEFFGLRSSPAAAWIPGVSTLIGATEDLPYYRIIPIAAPAPLHIEEAAVWAPRHLPYIDPGPDARVVRRSISC